MGRAYEPVPRRDVRSEVQPVSGELQHATPCRPGLARPADVLWLQRMAGNQATSAALHVQRSPEENEKAEQKLKEHQQRVYKLLAAETVWDRARTGPTVIPNDNAAHDRDRVFANSSEWIRKGWGSLSVVAPVPGAARGQYFDGTAVYPNVAAQVANTVRLPGDAAGFTDSKLRRVYIYMPPGAEPDNTRVRDLINHEVQHLADVDPPITAAEARSDEDARAAADTSVRSDQEKREQAMRDRIAWSIYQSEFRGYWLEGLRSQPQTKDGKWHDLGPDGGFGSELASGRDVKVVDNLGLVKGRPGCLPEITVKFSNEKQSRIADHLLNGNGPCCASFLSSQYFRDQVVALDRPQGVNLVNSIRIENLRQAITPKANSWDGRMQVNEGAVADWTKALDETDIAFLKDPVASRPFWDLAKSALRQELYDWLSGYIRTGNKDAPPGPASR
jgi:hypothetical protein